MRRQIFLHDHPDRFIVGTVGEPGQRVFFIQARSGRRLNSVVLEKEQARLLGERIGSLLDDMIAKGHLDPVVGGPAAGVVDDGPLDTPIEEDFRAGVLGLGWNSESGSLTLEAFAAGPDDTDAPDLESDSDEGPDTLRVRLSPAAARAFARRALATVAAGRPACPFCQLPLEPEGHICPRANGYRR